MLPVGTCVNLVTAGLQTPRLKRLAEIVSSQAIAQQEKMEFEHTNSDGEMGMNGEQLSLMEEEVAA
jgi:myosin-5